MERAVVCKFIWGQPLVPIILSSVNETSQVLLEGFVLYLDVRVGFRMIGSGESDSSLKSLPQLLPKVRNELRIPVTVDLLGDPSDSWHHVFHKQFSRLFCRDVLGTRK